MPQKNNFASSLDELITIVGSLNSKLKKEFYDLDKTDYAIYSCLMNDPMKDEYLLPTIADRMINEGTAFSVLSSEDHWFGVTYQEDKPSVVESFRNLIDSGAYRPDLYSDL